MTLAIIISLAAAALVFWKTKKMAKANTRAKAANIWIISITAGMACFIVLVSMKQEPGKPAGIEAMTTKQEVVNEPRKAKAKGVLTVEEWRQLYAELEEFKHDSVFKEYGFGMNGQILQRQWLEKVNNNILPTNVNPAWQAVPSNLRQLAMAYVREDHQLASKLQRELNKVFDNGNT